MKTLMISLYGKFDVERDTFFSGQMQMISSNGSGYLESYHLGEPLEEMIDLRMIEDGAIQMSFYPSEESVLAARKYYEDQE